MKETKDIVAVESIRINIGKTKVKMSLDEAKELQECLNDLFGHDKTEKTVYIPGSPVIIERPLVQRYPKWEVDWKFVSDDNSTGTPMSRGTVTYSLNQGFK